MFTECFCIIVPMNVLPVTYTNTVDQKTGPSPPIGHGCRNAPRTRWSAWLRWHTSCCQTHNLRSGKPGNPLSVVKLLGNIRESFIWFAVGSCWICCVCMCVCLGGGLFRNNYCDFFFFFMCYFLRAMHCSRWDVVYTRMKMEVIVCRVTRERNCDNCEELVSSHKWDTRPTPDEPLRPIVAPVSYHVMLKK